MLTGMGVAVERNDVLGDVDVCLLSTLAPTTNARMCSCARRCMRCEGRAGHVGVAKWVMINADPRTRCPAKGHVFANQLSQCN